MKFTAVFSAFLFTAFLCVPSLSFAQTVNVNASTLIAHASVSFAPRTGTFVEGATFQVPLVLDTKGASINGVDVRIDFDPSKLSVVNPSSGQSIIGVWVEPPTYDNTRGVIKYVGVIPNGIVTNSGVIATISFRAKTPGQAVLYVRSDSDVLVNDGLGSSAMLEPGRGEYTIIGKPPEGVSVYSETHPSQNDWSNNKSPVVSWEKEPGVTGFSFVLDTKPNTVPENIVTGTEATKAFENLADGLWYFHIKALKNGVWGGTTHYLVRIDTTPPAEFKPEASYVMAAAVLVNRALVSFFTTDNLSGIDHYEVGVIDKASPPTESPVFVDAESPFQVPAASPAGLKVIVRAIDKAGNVRDESMDVQAPVLFGKFLSDYAPWILVGMLALILLGLAIQYAYGHHIIANIKRAWAIVRRDSAREEMKEAEDAAKGATLPPPPVPPKDSETPLGGS